MADLLTAEDVWGNQVRLTDGRWNDHILVRHPEMAPYLDEIRECVVEPGCVYESATNPDRRVFYRLGLGVGRYTLLYLRVIVDYGLDAPWVVTAHFSTGLAAGGKLLWLQHHS